MPSDTRETAPQNCHDLVDFFELSATEADALGLAECMSDRTAE